MGTIKLNTTYQRIAMKNKNAYVTRATNYSMIKAEDVLDFAEKNSGMTRETLSGAMTIVVRAFETFLMNGHSVQLPELGTFRFSISCKAVDNEEDISTENVRSRKIIFTPSRRVRNAIRQVSLESIDNNDDDNTEESAGE